MTTKENGAVSAAPLQFTERYQQSMNNSIIPYSGESRQPSFFEFDGNRVAIVYDGNGNPWFDGPDVCKSVSIANASNAYKRLDDDERQPLHQIEGVAPQPGLERIYVSE